MKKGTLLTRYGPVILYGLLIFCISSIPNLSTPGDTFRIIDKVAHFVEFGIFGYLLAYAFTPSQMIVSRKKIAAVVFVGILYGLLDEIHQSFVPGREADFYDFLADTLGVCLAVFLWVLIRRKASLSR